MVERGLMNKKNNFLLRTLISRPAKLNDNKVSLADNLGSLYY